MLALMTDGVEESLSAEDELFGNERVLATIRAGQGGAAKKIVAALHDAGHAHLAADVQPDDYTTIVLKAL